MVSPTSETRKVMIVPVPSNILSLTAAMVLKVRPVVHACLRRWKNLAKNIPDPELRKQALASMETKKFHCEGGSLYGLLAEQHYREAIEFIVAYQTMSDYLDNLCDRSTSQNPQDFRALHEAMLHALTPDAPTSAYYRFRREQEDGGYLSALVSACRSVVHRLPDYPSGAPSVRELANVYIDLQVNKHVRSDERVPRLQAWFSRFQKDFPEMTWYEFSASAGSTLGIYCIVSLLFHRKMLEHLPESIRKAYFPWLQGLHILLDYLIDQEEDRNGSDLNFCYYYENMDCLYRRIGHFYHQAQAQVSGLPDARFHHLMIYGLLGIYLADPKVTRQKDVLSLSRKLLRLGGMEAFFFYWQCWIYRRWI